MKGNDQGMQRGEIYWMPWGPPVIKRDEAGDPVLDEDGEPVVEQKPRPVIIVSRDTLNDGNYVSVVPCTTQKLHQRINYPNCVYFKSGSFGFPEDCVAQCDLITFVDKKHIDWKRDKMGRVDAPGMAKITKAVRWVVRCDEL